MTHMNYLHCKLSRYRIFLLFDDDETNERGNNNIGKKNKNEKPHSTPKRSEQRHVNYSERETGTQFNSIACAGANALAIILP